MRCQVRRGRGTQTIRLIRRWRLIEVHQLQLMRQTVHTCPHIVWIELLLINWIRGLCDIRVFLLQLLAENGVRDGGGAMHIGLAARIDVHIILRMQQRRFAGTILLLHSRFVVGRLSIARQKCLQSLTVLLNVIVVAQIQTRRALHSVIVQRRIRSHQRPIAVSMR